MELLDLFGLKDKNVVVTGSNSGMGKAATEMLTKLGARVYAVDIKGELDLPVELELHADLSDQAEIDALIEKLPSEIEALYVCHGISDSPGFQNCRIVQLTNFFSFKYLTEALLPRIADNGSVTFISSVGGRDWPETAERCLSLFDCAAFEEAKAWYEENMDVTELGYSFAKRCQMVYVMTQCQDPKFIDRKIRLNAIAPGMTKTGLTHDFNSFITGDADEGQAILESLFLESWNGRWATPEEMGYPMAVVGSKLFSYMSGQILYIDYGETSHYFVDNMDLI